VPFAPWEEGGVQMIAPQNKHVDMLNEMVQAVTTKRADIHPFSKCYPGDAVRFTENTEHYKNGDEGTLIRIDDGGGVVSRKKKQKRGGGRWEDRVGVVDLRDGSRVTVSPNHIVPAYATTVHKVQGSEYDRVALVLFRDTFHKMMTREMVYTSVTRAKHGLWIVGYLPFLEDLAQMSRRTLMPYV
jgi:exodeoxyribonuclease V alpha subunit